MPPPGTAPQRLQLEEVVEDADSFVDDVGVLWAEWAGGAWAAQARPPAAGLRTGRKWEGCVDNAGVLRAERAGGRAAIAAVRLVRLRYGRAGRWDRSGGSAAGNPSRAGIARVRLEGSTE
jgi:hypothetical protein